MLAHRHTLDFRFTSEVNGNDTSLMFLLSHQASSSFIRCINKRWIVSITYLRGATLVVIENLQVYTCIYIYKVDSLQQAGLKICDAHYLM